ncbi:hypothetical protein RR48_02912 [Papilio machaon]|uniref:Uncharacterized protein n=1 Tax=Papilio machaon TaxID=76193 RepID=A0A0N1IFH7_PAPMA|nr:uncharacterized protein LOC106716331 [Papilio machaon]KPJ09934.1 hypothetical protein RR48_02912 [Papilio machaon]
MAIGVDTSKWKPRKLKGTPAAKVSNIIGISVVTFGVICGVFYQFSSITANFRKKLEPFYEDSEPEVERRLMIASGLRNRSGDMIRKLREEEARPDTPDK